MTRTFVPLRRVAALSVAITLFAAPIAAAQSREAAPPSAAPPNTALLSPAAFARLVQPPPADVARAPAAAESPRLDLLRKGKVAASAHMPTSPMKPPRQQQNWFMRNPGLAWLIIGGGIVLGAYLAACGFRTTCDG